MTNSPTVRAPLPSEREGVLATVRAAELLPAEDLNEVGDELDASLTGAPQAGSWLVAAQDASIDGVAYYAAERMADGAWNLYLLAVHPDRQGRGLGAALVRAVEADLRGRDARLLVIETSGLPSFADQRRFYARLGYVEQGRITDFYAAGDDKVIVARSL